MKDTKRFTIVDYEEKVEQRLGRLAARYRTCFSIWCLHHIFSSWHAHMSASLSAADAQYINATIDSLWKQILANTVPPMEELSSIRKRCNVMAPEACDTLSEFLQVELLGAIQGLIDVIAIGGPRHAVLVGEDAINCIDAEVNSHKGRSTSLDLAATPEIAAELRVQDEMLCYLESSPTLVPEDIDRFRRTTS